MAYNQHQNHGQNPMLKFRQNSRLRDIAESQNLLLELVTSEPTILQCFRVVESTCLSQGIFCRIQGKEVTPEFQRFMDDHYLPFCKAAIRAMFTYGFVPWRTRRLGKGDEIPEVLPPGTFSWHTEVGPEEQERRKRHGGRPATSGSSRPYSSSSSGKGRAATDADTGKPGSSSEHPVDSSLADDESRLVVYRVTPTAGGVREEDISIYISTPPSLDVSINSNLYSTVPSPLSYLLTDYKNLREAQRRRSHADAWNTTARLVSTFKPNIRVDDNPAQNLMDFAHEDHYAAPAVGESLFPRLMAHNVWQREHVMRRQFMETPSNHHPEVYALPRDHDIIAQPHLEPCEDLQFLLEKYRQDVSALTGVPHEMISGRGGGSHETIRKTMASGRIFSTNMHEICRHVQQLLSHVYSRIYLASPNSVEFLLVPMPRLEVETIQDFKVLHEIGALTPDMTVKLSRVLLGDEPSSMNSKKRKATPGGGAQPEALAGTSSQAPMSNFEAPPSNPKAGQKPPGQAAGLKSSSNK
jgi:hypothetical protein